MASGVSARPVYGPDDPIDQQRAQLFGHLCALVEHLEADSVAGERRRVLGPHHLSAEARAAEGLEEVEHGRIGVDVGDELGADDHVRRVEEVQAAEIGPEVVRASRGETVDREPGAHRGHHGPRATMRLDEVEHVPLDRQILGDGLEHEVCRGEGGR